MQTTNTMCNLYDHDVQAFLAGAYRQAKTEKLRPGPRVILNAVFGRQRSLNEYVQAVIEAIKTQMLVSTLSRSARFP